MDVLKLKSKWKKIYRGWKRCPSVKDVNVVFRCSNSFSKLLTHRIRKTSKVAPKGCFSVYVGSEKQRFVVRTELVNHPLFKILLDDAEMEYGYSSEGPILLPCEVDLFYKVLAEMESSYEHITSSNCSSFILCSPAANYSPYYTNIRDYTGYGGYRILSSSHVIWIDQF